MTYAPATEKYPLDASPKASRFFLQHNQQTDRPIRSFLTLKLRNQIHYGTTRHVKADNQYNLSLFTQVQF
jgi:hypothetical protein